MEYLKNIKYLIVVVFLLSLSCSKNPRITKPAHTGIYLDITSQEALNILTDTDSDNEYIIIDVSTPDEFHNAHIDNAINLNYYEDTFRSNIGKLDKNKKYIVYCSGGYRSKKTMYIMQKLEFMQVYNISDGLDAWRNSRYPTANK